MSNITVRRSIPDDIPHIRSLVSGPSADRYSQLFGDDVNLSYEIETSFLCITALDARENIIGFISLLDCPRQKDLIAPDVWHSWLRQGGQYVLDDDAFRHIYACNTLWVSFLAVEETPEEADVVHTMLTTAFATCAMIHNVLVLCKDVDGKNPASSFSSLNAHFFHEIPRTNRTTSQKTNECEPIEISASILSAGRTSVIPPLKLRPGVVEDYDDFVPLLLAGDGVVTPLPTDLYLEELLQNQDTYHHVVVAEDPLTRRPVGLLCLTSTYEEQQHLVKQYATDIFNKLKPQFTQTVKGQQSGHNVFHLSFFYLDPAYEARSLQFLQHAFQLFPFAEYCFVFLPHAAAEHPILQYFANVPIKKFQPTNLQGERLPLPQGMWLCCRYSLENVSVSRITPDQEDQVTKLLRNQPEISQEGVEAMCVALSNSIPLTAGQSNRKDIPFATYVMQWREMIIGVMIVRFVNVEETYALRENFDLDSFVNFLPSGDKPMHICDITLDAEEAKQSFYTNNMPAVVIKHVYMKPIFRNRLRFLMREALRFSSTELLVYMASMETESFAPLIGELVLVPPRRMIDHPQNAQNPAGRDDNAPDDVDSLACLYHSSRKSLSDEKTKIHARIVVVGAGTTGLAFIHSLLSIPYLQFTNILLVSTDGLPLHPNQQELNWNSDSLDFLEREYMTLRIGKRVRLLEGTMIDFDKFDKYICTDGSNCEPYDYLFITAGRQYAIPRELVSQHGAKNGVFPLCNQHYIAKIKQHIHESEIYEDDLSSAVIFGTNLDVFAVANNIIKLGLAPQRVVIVSPDSGTVNPFGDPLIELKVEELLLSMGTKILKAHVLERLEYDEDNNLSSVVVTPVDGNRGKSVEVNATMFIYVHDKDIDSQVLSALNKRSIVFDGRVIIENNYRTTDPNIFAAGPVAMFSRRFGKTEDFDVYSARDVGRHLAETLLGFIGIDEFYNPVLHKEDEETKGGPKDDPLAAELGSAKKGAEDVRRRPKALPKYEANISRKVMLPGDYMFFTCCGVNFASIESECTMLKSSSENGNNYVRIAVGPNKYIEAVSYFGSDPVEIYNLSSLVGLPESVLNLLYRYSEVNRNADPTKGTKPFDILAYMRSPWATAIFYDRFRKLFADIKSRLQEHPDAARVKADIVSLEVKDNTDKITDDDRDKYHRRLAHDQSDARHVIELEVLKYLHEARPFLPQLYFLPDINPYVPRYT
ncbi:Hypothetical protein, putative [Bodo saltans]|uniref:Uncharacterized protein n=1 Tax=Bodo saltans TaxID=75058 RepID=A0A0S4JMF3_BODSA|nr:Hypothetical protein, putative [Bodo saltans]|eukprot:CUG90290.1 Hypothetical protein, putative [Bodo saltans]